MREQSKALEGFVNELAYYRYQFSECMEHGANDSAEYWETKISGFAQAVEIATGYYPTAVRHGDKIYVIIGASRKDVTVQDVLTHRV